MGKPVAVSDTSFAGLSARQAAERLAQDGPNCLPQERHRGAARIALEALREPMLQLLLLAAVLYFFLGDRAEALILLAFAMANVALVVVQESRTERALAALQNLTARRASVIRRHPGRTPPAHRRPRVGGRGYRAGRGRRTSASQPSKV